MTLIIFKIILASSFFVAVYFFVLQKEKTFIFNRFYLLFSLVFSYIIPFVIIQKEIPKPKNLQIVFEETVQHISVENTQTEIFSLSNFIWILYGLISLFFLMKAVFSLIKIMRIKGKKIIYQNFRIVLTEEKIAPFSFWKTIYLNKKYYTENKIEDTIFIHEKAHLKQKHSLDLLFVELMKILSWWNPALYFYRKAIVTNHEFLADEEVLKNGFKVKEYQTIILKELIEKPHFQLVHSFNFNNTKKRFIMMTFKNSKFSGMKKIASFALLVPAFFLLAQKTYATEKPLINEKIDAKEILKTAEKITETETEKVVLDTIKKNPKEEIKVQNSVKKEDIVNVKNSEVPPPPPPAIDGDYVQAEFPGGMNVLRNKFSQAFNGSVFTGSEKTMKSTIYLSINEKGEITKITVEGDNLAFNQESQRTFTEVTKGIVFTPAKLKGNPVESMYKFPLTMSFHQ